MLLFSNGLFTSEQLPSISWEKDEDVSEGNEDVPAFVVSAALLDRYDISSHLVLSYLIYQKDLAQLYLHWCLPLCILMLLLTCQIKAEYIPMIHSIEYYFYPSIFCIRNLCFFFLMVVYLWTVTLNIRGEKDKDIPEENEDDSNFVGSAALLDIDMIFHHTLCCNIWFIRNILHKYIYRDAYPHAFFCFCLPGIHVPMRCNCLESK